MQRVDQPRSLRQHSFSMTSTLQRRPADHEPSTPRIATHSTPMAHPPKQRILWILNHTTLMDWEVPMLMELGFEVYIPKHLPQGPNSRTATVTTKYDASLSIPREDLEYLNQQNFYESPISAKTADIINRHFSNCICAYIFPGLYYILQSFRGRVFMRAFGHAGTFDYESATDTVPLDSLKQGSYTSTTHQLKRRFLDWNRRLVRIAGIRSKNPIMREMFLARDRIYLAAAYQEIIDHEKPFLKQRSLFMPLALPDSILSKKNTWRGGDPRIFFVCPNIDQIDYYHRIYKRFVEELGSFPYCIGGRQDLGEPVTEPKTQDPNILGFVDRSVFEERMNTSLCMFYHSQEERHLHYHPLEAIVAGLPLIYMSGGLLEKCGGPDQPGMCRSYEEARAKIRRLQAGDDAFRSELLVAQQRILRPFESEYCTSIWKKNFAPIALKVAS